MLIKKSFGLAVMAGGVQYFRPIEATADSSADRVAAHAARGVSSTDAVVSSHKTAAD